MKVVRAIPSSDLDNVFYNHHCVKESLIYFSPEKKHFLR
jgi:hypothetical protein